MRLVTLVAPVLMLASCATAEIATVPPPPGPELERDTLVTADGALLPLHRWMPTAPPRAVVIALHGMNDYGRSFSSLGRYLAQRGVATYAYDQRGFGGAPGRNWWPGTETLVADLTAATDLLRRRYPGTPIHCLGESMGGAVVLVAAARVATHCDSTVLAAPAIWGKQTMSALERTALAVAESVAPDTVVQGAGLKIRPSDNLAALRALRADPLVIKGARVDAIAGLASLMTEAFEAAAQVRGPTLWLHGKNDQIIAPRPTRAALGRLPPDPGIRVARYPLGYHLLTRDLEAAVVAHDVASWIFAPDAPLPSGADRAETAQSTTNAPSMPNSE
jgi:alpha-beta hydrolase superfamily lysophospholipase